MSQTNDDYNVMDGMVDVPAENREPGGDSFDEALDKMLDRAVRESMGIYEEDDNDHRN